MICESTDFIYPLQADIYYPLIDQGAYGNLKKQWVIDKTIACFFNPSGTKTKEDVTPNANVVLDNVLIGRVRTDILTSSRGENYSFTNIIISNIRDRNGNVIYDESSGPRNGRPTLFEIATFTPVVGPFGTTEYYKILIRRSENQAVDL